MKQTQKALLGILAVTSVTVAQFGAHANPGLPRESSIIAEQNRTLTSEESYSSLRHANMAVGLIDHQSSPFEIKLGFQTQKLRTENDSTEFSTLALTTPSFVAGTPEHIAFSAYYGNTPLSVYGDTPLSEFLSGDSLTMKMPMHHMGAGIAIQNEAKTFRFGFNGDVFVGKSEYDGIGDSGRVALGIEDLALSFGSAPHELISFDLGIFATASFDSLGGTASENKLPLTKEFIVQSIFPAPGINLGVNFGNTEYPVLSSFAFTFAPKHFGYETKFEGRDVKIHDKIKTDSISWHLKNRITFEPVEDRFKVNPSFDFAFMHNRHKLMTPGTKDAPWENEGEHEGFKWDTKSFKFGFGVDIEVVQFFDYWIEYGHSNMNLELLGDSIKEYANDDDFEGDSHKEDFHRFTTGFEVAIHKIPGLSYSETGELFFDASFMHLQESGMYKSFYGVEQYEHFRPIQPGSEMWRYSPWETITDRVRTHDVSLGLRASFAERTFEIDGRVNFVNQKHSGEYIPDVSGPRFGFNFIYNHIDRKVYE